MSLETQHLEALRRVINENLRVQRGGADPVPYIDVSSALSDIRARQNHAVFARRGCGKTLLLNHSAKELPGDVQAGLPELRRFQTPLVPKRSHRGPGCSLRCARGQPVWMVWQE